MVSTVNISCLFMNWVMKCINTVRVVSEIFHCRVTCQNHAFVAELRSNF